MTREEIRKQVGEFRLPLIAMFAEQGKDREFHGERMTLHIEGKEYRMCHYASEQENPTVYFDIHGGGYSWGTMEDGDLFCHLLCKELGYEVYAPEYPLTPESEYPEALYYIYDMIHYMRLHAEEYHFNPNQMIIGGRSAGGNMAAALCLLAKERGDFQFVCQILDHPWLDLCGLLENDKRYHGEFSMGMDNLKALAIAYAPEEKRSDIYVSPLAATDEQLKNLPPAIIQTCEWDCLRLDGDEYAKRLETVGVPVIHHCFKEVIHGFSQDVTKEGEQGRQWLKRALVQMMEKTTSKE